MSPHDLRPPCRQHQANTWPQPQHDSDGWSDAVRVHPWIGQRYRQPAHLPFPTLILGESNYTEPHLFTPELVRNCVLNDLGDVNRDTGGFCRFSTKIRRLMLGRDEHVGPDLWHDVAFYNFIQQLVGNTARTRPGPAMWRESLPALVETIERLRPERMLVLGRTNWNNLLRHVPATVIDKHRATLHIGHHAIVSGYVNHPSSSLRYATWVPCARLLLGLDGTAGSVHS